MNTTTLRGIFPDPSKYNKPPVFFLKQQVAEPVHRRNFLKENIRNLKEMQGLVPQEAKIRSQSLMSKNKYQNVAPRVYNNLKRNLSKGDTRPASYNPQKSPGSKPNLTKNKSDMSQKISHRGVQTERPEDISKLYETGVLKYPTSVIAKLPNKIRGEQGDVVDKTMTNLQKLDLDSERQNYVKQNIKNIKPKSTKKIDSPDPLQPPANYQKGALPKYLKDKKEELKCDDFDTENLSGLVLLPDDERKEYLRVARESNLLTLI